MRRRAGWSLALRIARREAWRARGRSLLVLVLIALPVVAVVAAAVVVTTSQVSGAEALDRRLGASDARVTVTEGTGRVQQDVDPEAGALASEGAPEGQAVASASDVVRTLGGGRLVPILSGGLRIRSDAGAAPVEGTEIDLTDPLAAGLLELTSGRWPGTADEVVANQALLDLGYAVGDRVGATDPERPSPRIVGVAESTTLRTTPVAAGPGGSLGLDGAGSTTWLVGGGDVTWDDVLALNAQGAVVLSRAVLTDPPPASEIPVDVRPLGQTDPATTAILVLVVAMVLLEVVLLAGPAFAVGAKRQARSLALLASSGATPAQARRTVLAGALVLGGTASVAGVVIGLAVAFAAMPLVQRYSDTWLGSYDVPWLAVAGVAGFGLLSALLAAVVPAVLASRQDVVAVLAGRRGEPRPSRRSPVLGAVLLAVGVALAAYGTLTRGSELAIAGSAVLCVLGMVLLVPVVLSLVGRAAGRMPLVVRYAVRDAARQRTRTAPAVAAVAAVVAGVVALGIGASSDTRESAETYEPSLRMGAGAVTAGYSETGTPLDGDWESPALAVERELPDATVTEIRGIGAEDADIYTELSRPGSREPVLSAFGSALGSSELVGAAALEALPALPPEVLEEARAALAAGRVVVFADEPGGSEVRLEVEQYDDSGESGTIASATLPATYLVSGNGTEAAQAVLPEEAVRELGAPVRTSALLVTGAPISEEAEQTVGEAVAATGLEGSFYVERGYVADDFYVIVLLVLGFLGGTLVLGGTLTATFLALSDARPDLATLAAIGASPRTRRGVAASYALVVGLVGAILGAAVGMVPGLAAGVTLTSTSGGFAVIEGAGTINELPAATGPFLDVPWLLVLALVVLLPLLSAALVGLCTRSRLPLVARAA